MKITIPNFNKFNPRKDLKTMPWFRCENNFYDLEDFYDADVNTCWLFIFLLCQCAQKVSAEIDLDRKYLIFKSKLTEKQFDSALSSLSSKGLILLDTNEHDRIRTDSCLTNEHNEHNTCTNVIEFDFNLIYDAYPKKAGKAVGMKKLQSKIKTQSEFDKILHGAKNYSEYVLQNNIEQKYIKQFSTWVNQECWNDELETESQVKNKIAELDSKLLEIFNENK
jgi:hypothetical protein